MVVATVVVASNVVDGDSKIYKNSGSGSCGDDLLKINIESVTICAIVCSQGKNNH